MAPSPMKTLRKRLNTTYDSLFHLNKDVVAVPVDVSDLKTTKSPSKQKEMVLAQLAGGGGVGDIHSGSVCGAQPNAEEKNKKRKYDDHGSCTGTVVAGQSILGLVGKMKQKEAKLRPMLFTNGDNVDLEHYLHSFIENPAEKLRATKIFASMQYSPSDSLIVASINCFSRKKKRHFFRDALYLTSVFAKEMKMTLSSFLRVRGWLVVNHNGVVKISYRRVGDCLRLLGVDAAMNYYRVSTMFDRLFRLLQSKDVFPEMPYEAAQTGEYYPSAFCSIIELHSQTHFLCLFRIAKELFQSCSCK
jgi:hypothetical protein